MSDTIEGLLPGSQDAVQQAIQGIILNEESLILRVHEDTYRLPRNYRNLTPQQLLQYGELHTQIKNAILNDGMSPVQLKALRDNRRMYALAERERQTRATEEQIWCDWLLPSE